MIFLERFRMPTRAQEENYFFSPTNAKAKRTCYTTKYPFDLFRHRNLPTFSFRDITIFCGNNGSGKSSILNVIAETLGLERTTPFNRSDFFEDYVELCNFQPKRSVPSGSKIITSDGVFEKVLDIRRINDGIDSKRADLIDEYIAENSDGRAPNRLQGLDDYDRWKRVSDMRNKNRSQSRFLKENLMRNIRERSNGESALSYFVDSIQENALYLLDEPENSLSPQNQLQLKYFIEDSVRSFGCQFIIATHSPFLLSLKGARIYNMDETPPRERAWTELECVRTYYDFFMGESDKFHFASDACKDREEQAQNSEWEDEFEEEAEPLGIRPESPFRDALVGMIVALDRAVGIAKSDQVLMVLHLDTEEKIMKFNEWVKTKLISENEIDATDVEIVQTAVLIGKGIM